MSELFCMVNLLEVGRKKTFFNIINFISSLPPPNQNEVKYSHNKCSDKSVLIEMTLKFGKSRKTKKKSN